MIIQYITFVRQMQISRLNASPFAFFRSHSFISVLIFPHSKHIMNNKQTVHQPQFTLIHGLFYFSRLRTAIPTKHVYG